MHLFDNLLQNWSKHSEQIRAANEDEDYSHPHDSQQKTFVTDHLFINQTLIGCLKLKCSYYGEIFISS